MRATSLVVSLPLGNVVTASFGRTITTSGSDEDLDAILLKFQEIDRLVQEEEKGAKASRNDPTGPNLLVQEELKGATASRDDSMGPTPENISEAVGRSEVVERRSDGFHQLKGANRSRDDSIGSTPDARAASGLSYVPGRVSPPVCSRLSARPSFWNDGRVKEINEVMKYEEELGNQKKTVMATKVSEVTWDFSLMKAAMPKYRCGCCNGDRPTDG